jgi:hypothetical protein
MTLFAERCEVLMILLKELGVNPTTISGYAAI